MLRVTADIFSGRENPSWLVDENDAKAILKEVATNRAVVAEVDSGYQGLGFRGLTLEFMSDDVAEKYSLPSAFKIANGASLYESKGLEIAEQLISTMSNATPVSSFMETSAAFEGENLQALLLEQLDTIPMVSNPSEADLPERAEAMAAKSIEPAAVCTIEVSPFNPGFWNNDPNVQRNNNCYNYASNRRTNTFAQPGRAAGFTPSGINCGQYTIGAEKDGARRHGNCLPDSEKPRWFMALVIWPGVDFHWYRKHSNGFWGHKPGSTPAINTDNSGRIITNPQTADRGGYIHFCGYMYAAKSMRVR